MLPLALLSLTLTAQPSGIRLLSTPHGAHFLNVTLLTEEQVEAAPVTALTITQLYSEDRRLGSPPTVVPSVTLICVGGGALLFGVVTTWLLINAANNASGWDGLGDALLAIVTIAIGIAGGIMGIVGGVMLPGKLIQRDEYAARQVEVRRQIAAIQAGQVAEPVPQVGETPRAQAELLKVEDERPGLGLPIGLMIGGLLVGTYGVYNWANLSSSHASTSSSGGISPQALSIGAVVVGLALEGIGAWFLISRLQTRAEIDDKLKQLQQPEGGPPPLPPMDQEVTPPPPPPPPSAQRLPPAPIFAAWAFRF